MVNFGFDAAATEDKTFGYLTVRVHGGQVWTSGGPAWGRYLGPLAGAQAVMDLERLSPYGTVVTMSGLGPHVVGALSVIFADGSRYARGLRSGALVDRPKIAAEIARFNAMAQPQSQGVPD